MAAFYANENFPLRVVRALRACGHDVLTTAEAGEAGRAVTDEAVLAFATHHERVVLTLNRRDFIRLHQQNPAHAGIVVCTQDADVIRQGARIDRAITEVGTLAGHLIRVHRPAS